MFRAVVGVGAKTMRGDAGITKQIHDFLCPASVFAMGPPSAEHHARTLDRIKDR